MRWQISVGSQGNESRGESVSARRAIYDLPENIFTTTRPPVPTHVFASERDKAFDTSTPTSLIDLDLGNELGFDYPATTPLLLARYLRVRDGESLTTELTATGEIHYVVQGGGESCNGNDVIAWRTGDLFCFPGGARTVHRAVQDAVLLQFTDEPLYAFTRAQPAPRGEGALEAVHYLAERIDERLASVHGRPAGEDAAGMAVQLISHATQRLGTCLPSIAVAVNSLAPGESQRPHVHNAAALTLCIQGQGCHSLIDGQRVDWQPNAVMVTPPAAVHSHHNLGDELMKCVIAQDSGLYYYARTPGFRFAD